MHYRNCSVNRRLTANDNDDDDDENVVGKLEQNLTFN